MPLRSEHVQSAGWIAVAVAFLWVLWLLGPILTPFLAGAVLAYILTPAVDWLAGRRVPRWAAAIHPADCTCSDRSGMMHLAVT